MHINKQNSYEISDFKFHYELNTRWKDMDVFGHVNNAVILTYIEDARITFFKRWNLKIQKKALILASVKIDYLHQITHPSNLIVGQKISRIGIKSFDIESALFKKGEKSPLALSTIVCVCFDFESNKSVSVYSEIIADYK